MNNSGKGKSATFSRLWLIPLMLCTGFGAYWLTVKMIPGKSKNEISETPKGKPKEISTAVELSEPRKSIHPKISGDSEATRSGAVSNQRAVVFKDDEAMRNFLAKRGGGVSVLGEIDKLNTLLIGYEDIADLEALLDGSEESSMIFPVNIPEFESVGAQAGVGAQAEAAPLGNGLLKWLGVEGDNSLWGEGMTIAILPATLRKKTH